MSTKARYTVYVGNLDERVSDRVLYDILIQAGRVVDLYIPRDRETEKPKGYAFAEYETEEVADYAVKLFSGLVTLYNRTLKFAISGQDKPSVNNSSANMPNTSSSHTQRPQPVQVNNLPYNQNFHKSSPSFRSPPYSENHSDVPPPPGVDRPVSGYGTSYANNDYGYSRRVFGETLDRSKSRRFDASRPYSYPSY